MGDTTTRPLTERLLPMLALGRDPWELAARWGYSPEQVEAAVWALRRSGKVARHGYAVLPATHEGTCHSCTQAYWASDAQGRICWDRPGVCLWTNQPVRWATPQTHCQGWKGRLPCDGETGSD